MKKHLITGFVFCFLFVTSVFADTFIKAEVDKSTLTTDDALTYKLTVTSSEIKLPAPQPPKFERFNIISQANSSTLSFVKGQIKSILVFVFILSPANTGKFKISPATIEISDKTYSSDAFEIEVKPGKAPPKITPKEKPSVPGQKIPESEESQTTL